MPLHFRYQVVLKFSSVQFSRSVVSDSLRPHESQHARPPCPSPTPMSIESVMPSNHLILCRRLLLPPSIFPSIRVFSNESALHIRQPKYWSFSFSISPSNEHSGLISLRIVRRHGEGNGTPLQYSCLESPMNGGAWWAAVHGVSELDSTK